MFMLIIVRLPRIERISSIRSDLIKNFFDSLFALIHVFSYAVSKYFVGKFFVFLIPVEF
jgi:hypothetical protein